MSEEFMKELNALRRLIFKRGYEADWSPFRCVGATFRIRGARGNRSVSTKDIEEIKKFITACGIELESETEAAQRILASYGD
jgi:hypothetical protein